jgi:hypothetical protein
MWFLTHLNWRCAESIDKPRLPSTRPCAFSERQPYLQVAMRATTCIAVRRYPSNLVRGECMVHFATMLAPTNTLL